MTTNTTKAKLRGQLSDLSEEALAESNLARTFLHEATYYMELLETQQNMLNPGELTELEKQWDKAHIAAQPHLRRCHEISKQIAEITKELSA